MRKRTNRMQLYERVKLQNHLWKMRYWKYEARLRREQEYRASLGQRAKIYEWRNTIKGLKAFYRGKL